MKTVSIPFTLLVLIILLRFGSATPPSPAPEVATPPIPAIDVSAPVEMGFLIKGSGPSAALFPSGPNLEKHEKYEEFKDAVKALAKEEVPEVTRNSWPFQRFSVDEHGHKPESEVRDFLAQKLVELNNQREQDALENNLPDPPDFTLTTGAPAHIYYVWSDGRMRCIHTYPVSLGGTPWKYSDPEIPATVAFNISTSWESTL